MPTLVGFFNPHCTQGLCKCERFTFTIATSAKKDAVMIVCVCRRISDREIARYAHAGISFDDIQFELGVATQCGCCESTARDLVAQCRSQAPVAALHKAIDTPAPML
jgi:bacterioferritin-associated ferredoxin